MFWHGCKDISGIGWITYSVSYEAVCRTDPHTPSLLFMFFVLNKMAGNSGINVAYQQVQIILNAFTIFSSLKLYNDMTSTVLFSIKVVIHQGSLPGK